MPSSLSRLALAAALACTGPFAVFAATPSNEPEATLSASDRQQIVETLVAKLRTRYPYPARADAIAAALRAHAAHGDFDGARTARAFAEALDRDLRAVGDDRHFRVRVDAGFDAALEDDNHVPTPEELAQSRDELRKMAWGVSRVQRLPGNVGYIDLRGFGPGALVGAAYDQAFALLAGTDALVVDLRSNGGGEPLAVSYFVSHFFAEGDERHLNDIYDHPTKTTREYWTMPVVGTRYLHPVMVLTSPRTASGAEECAYDLQTQKRATLVGEVTAGAANPGGPVALGHGLVAFVPSGRAINAVTHTDWEKVGVRPELAVPAADAMKTAYLALLDQRLAAATDPEEKDDLQGVRQRAADGKIDLPGYVPQR
jgi:hypothetical protein